MRGLRLAGSWVLAVFLGVMSLWIADLTLFPGDGGQNVVFPELAEYSGISLWEPTGRLLVGLLHVIAAIFLIMPWTRRIGAVLSGLIALGAVAAHVLWLGPSVPLEAGSIETDGGQLLYLALALLAVSVLLFFLHPGKK
jgi:hypothetical protein